jgi:ribosomal protein S18 acetylase RimI-like enzyme
MTVHLLDPEAADDGELVERLTDLINAVYATAESGLWSDGSARTSASEVAGLIRGGEIAVATREGEVVGAVRLQDVAGDVAEFGMLVADPEQRARGIGRELLDFAEESARERGMRTMQLELLVPREWSHPSKEFLRDWYGRRGYRLVRTGHLDEAYPHLAPLLATECDFEIHHKPL